MPESKLIKHIYVYIFALRRYIPAHLENMFSKYARTVPDKLTLREIWRMTEANRDAFDFFGWSLHL